jgi:hypothetical protein
MKITRTSPFSGKLNSMEINATKEQLNDWDSGTPIQYAMPHLSPEEREFVKTGITPEERETNFGKES